MPLSLITETTPLLPLSNNTSTWKQTIKIELMDFTKKLNI